MFNVQRSLNYEKINIQFINIYLYLDIQNKRQDNTPGDWED
jgi:hypothetical protein